LSSKPKANQDFSDERSGKNSNSRHESRFHEEVKSPYRGYAAAGGYRSKDTRRQDPLELDLNDIAYYEPVEHPVKKSDKNYTLEEALFNFFRTNQIIEGYDCQK
jgi:hypothetical protein